MHKQFRKIYETTSTTELELIKVQFRVEEISYRTLYEQTLQTGHIAALGSHGAVIEVLDKDWHRARMVLERSDIVVENMQQEPHPIVQSLYRWTLRLPVLGNWSLEARIMTLAALLLSVAFGLIILWIYA